MKYLLKVPEQTAPLEEQILDYFVSTFSFCLSKLVLALKRFNGMYTNSWKTPYVIFKFFSFLLKILFSIYFKFIRFPFSINFLLHTHELVKVTICKEA